MHPVQFAIIGIVSLAFGLVTPPYGLCLMISCAIAKVRLRYALKDTMIMLVPMLLVLAAIIVWPEIPLLLPRLISPEFLRTARSPHSSVPAPTSRIPLSHLHVWTSEPKGRRQFHNYSAALYLTIL